MPSSITQFKKGHQAPATAFKRGNSPWNKGVKGKMIAWNKGMKMSDEHRKKLSIAHKGIVQSEESKEKKRNYRHTKEALSKIVSSSIGRVHPPRSIEWKTKQRESKKGMNSGEKSYLWKGGITPINDKIRHSVEYKNWRDRIFQRDNYTCLNCKAVGTRLNADHYPIAFSIVLEEIKNKYGIESLLDIAMRYPKLWDINNGRTLCVRCHKDVHKTKKNANK